VTARRERFVDRNATTVTTCGPHLMLDQMVTLLLGETAQERRAWIAAHARACDARRPRQPVPPRWRFAVLVAGKVVSVDGRKV